MRLYLTRRFQERFENLPPPIQRRVEQALQDLAQRPLSGKKLSGPLVGHWSWRVGRYRILYAIREGCLFAETVRHRKDVYRA